MSLAKRAVQAARIGLAARKVKKSATEAEKVLARRALAGLFADARGVTMKIGQLFASQGGNDPFADLVESIEPLPLEDMLPVIEVGLGRPSGEVFESIEESSAAASLGQVHRAVLKDGVVVAVKVRYPGIAEAVEAELKLAGLMPGLGPVKKWGFDLGGYKAVLKANMDRELDYLNEAARQIRFGENVLVPGLIVPGIHQDLTSAQVLVQDWHDGVRLHQVSQWPAAVRSEVGRILLGTLFHSLFESGEVHGDPHPGNTYYRRGDDGRPEVVLMDYGCTVAVPETTRLALLKLLLALREDGEISAVQTYAAMGFDSKKLLYIAGALPMLNIILFHPFLQDGTFFASTWDLKRRLTALLGDNRWWFRSAGPPTNILLMRAFQGVAQQLDQIKASLDWWQVLLDHVPAETLQKARDFELPPLSAEYAGKASDLSGLNRAAKHLKVEVMEGRNQIVAMAMPAEAALDLEGIMPEDVLAHVREQGEYDLEAILREVRESGLQPGEILNFDKGERRYRVWLE